MPTAAAWLSAMIGDGDIVASVRYSSAICGQSVSKAGTKVVVALGLATVAAALAMYTGFGVDTAYSQSPSRCF